MKKVTITVRDDYVSTLVKLIIDDIHELKIEDVSQTGLHFDPTSFEIRTRLMDPAAQIQAEEQAQPQPEPKPARKIHREVMSAPQQIITFLNTCKDHKSKDTEIVKFIVGKGFAKNTTWASLSKLKIDGLIKKTTFRGGNYWELVQ